MATKLKGESNEKDAYFNRALESAAPNLLASAGLLPSQQTGVPEDDDFYGDEEIAPSELAVAMGFPSAKEYVQRKNAGPVMIQSSSTSQHVSDDRKAADAQNSDDSQQLDGEANINQRIATLQQQMDEKEDRTHDRDDEDDSELKRLREIRLKKLKDSQIWAASYNEITQDEFLPTVTQASRVVCHFYHNDFERCKILDKHLSDLCLQYRSTRFVKLNAEKAPFFVTKLSIRTLPTLIFFKDGIAIDRLVGFDGLGADDFPTSVLVRRLAVAGMVDAPQLMKEKNGGKGGMIGGQKISSRLGAGGKKTTSAQARLKARDGDSDDENEDD